MGAETVWHNWECSQAGDSQHSGSSQSTRPSVTRKVMRTYMNTVLDLTFVIVNLVITALLQPDVTPRPIPSALTETFPALLVVGHGAGPMAIAVAGGMTSSTLLTLFVIPVAYTLVDDLVKKVKVLWQRKNGVVYQSPR